MPRENCKYELVCVPFLLDFLTFAMMFARHEKKDQQKKPKLIKMGYYTLGNHSALLKYCDEKSFTIAL